jgi:hypothetical protein
MPSEYHRDYMRRYRALHKAIKLPDLNWPRNLFGYPYNHDELLGLTQRRLKHDDLCSCGKPHHNNFPWTVRSDHGFGFNVYYFCSNACKSRSVREHQ